MPKPKVPFRFGPEIDGEKSMYCRICDRATKLSSLHTNRGSKTQTNVCKTCRTARTRWRHQGFECTWALYNQMFAKQGGLCAICRGQQAGFRKRLNVDHDHKTGRVRELLCHGCNVSLGHFDDSVELLKTVIAYLEKHRAIPQHQSEIVDVRQPPRHGKAVGRRNPQLRLLA